MHQVSPLSWTVGTRKQEVQTSFVRLVLTEAVPHKEQGVREGCNLKDGCHSGGGDVYPRELILVSELRDYQSIPHRMLMNVYKMKWKKFIKDKDMWV